VIMRSHFSSPVTASPPAEPQAEQRPLERTLHDLRLIDEYAWLKAENWREVIRDPFQLDPAICAYLQAENDYCERALANTKSLQETLFAEMKGRIKEDGSSAPDPDGPYAYYVRYRKEGQHPLLCREPRNSLHLSSMQAADVKPEEQLLIDGDALERGKAFFRLGATRHSSDHRLLAWLADEASSPSRRVSKYMIRHREPPSQHWRTFLRNHADAIAAIDLCVVPTLTFECLFAFVVMGHGRRQLLWFAVTRHPTAEWLAQQIVEAFPWNTAPTYLVHDNDGAYGQAFISRGRAMGIRDRPTSPRSPWQNPYVERLIGTLWRDCLDHVLILGEWHLRRVLTLYSLYYNETRTHVGLSKDAPRRCAVQRSGTIVTAQVLSGLHHRYVRI
jgi:transposase InsO family protein